MKFLKRLPFGAKAENPPPADARDIPAENAALADDPVRFATWVGQYCVLGPGHDDDEMFGPPPDQCERLQITAEQRAACIREHVMMTALGACLFVGRNFPVAYYDSFKQQICATTAQRIHGMPTESRLQDVASAVDQYVHLLIELDGGLQPPANSSFFVDFGMTFLQRAIPGNPFHLELLPVGAHAFNIVVQVFTSVRDGYHQLKFGLSFEAAQGLDRATDSMGITRIQQD